jgi:hypothetical protein
MQQSAYYCDSPKPVATFNVIVAHNIACPSYIKKHRKGEPLRSRLNDVVLNGFYKSVKMK